MFRKNPVCRGEVEAVKAALRRGKDPNTRGGLGVSHGFTLLMAAVCGGDVDQARPRQVEVVEALLLHPGLDVNATHEPGRWTALHLACMYGAGDMVRLLVAHSWTHIWMLDSSGMTPLAMAVVKAKGECARILVQVPGALDFDFNHLFNYSLVTDTNEGVKDFQMSKSQLKVFKIIKDAKVNKNNAMRTEENKRGEEEKKKTEEEARKKDEEQKEETIRKMGKGKGRNARRKKKQAKDNQETSLEKGKDGASSTDDIDLMEEALGEKEREAEEESHLDQIHLNLKTEELSQLKSSVKKYEATESMQNKALSDIDEQIKDLEKKKSKIQQDKKKTLSIKAKAEDEKVNLEQHIIQIKMNKEEKAKTFQEDIGNLRKKLSNARLITKENSITKTKANPAPEPVGVADTRLEEFISRQVAALEEELECPVCLEVLTTSPLYKCADDHLICPGCRPKVERCPQCRETYPTGEFTRFRGAERQAERLVGLYQERQLLLQSSD